MRRFAFDFGWDPSKEVANLRKHGVDFDLASTVFRDPLAATRYDDDHSEREERWVTVGQARTGALLVVVHTFEETAPGRARLRLISARPATAHERRQYEHVH